MFLTEEHFRATYIPEGWIGSQKGDVMWGYVRIRAWHIVKTPTRMFDTYVTLCGRRATGETVDALPAGSSCEACLRIARRQTDAQQEADSATI